LVLDFVQKLCTRIGDALNLDAALKAQALNMAARMQAFGYSRQDALWAAGKQYESDKLALGLGTEADMNNWRANLGESQVNYAADMTDYGRTVGLDDQRLSSLLTALQNEPTAREASWNLEANTAIPVLSPYWNVANMLLGHEPFDTVGGWNVDQPGFADFLAAGAGNAIGENIPDWLSNIGSWFTTPTNTNNYYNTPPPTSGAPDNAWWDGYDWIF